MNQIISYFLPIIYLTLTLSFSLPPPTTAADRRCHPDDKKTLLKIKKDLGNPYVLASWDPKFDCCEWYVVECDEHTNRIVTFNVMTGEISGQIPASIGNLPYLTFLRLHKIQNLTGNIPSSITKLNRLTYLEISWTNLSGQIPAFLGEMKNLTFINLSFNNFTGTIPESLGELQKLDALHLDRNKLTGTIPESFGNFPAKSPPDLFLSHNQLTGTVPKSLGNLDFERIDLSRNKLEGDVSFLFGPNKSAQIIDLSRNQFQFDFSKVNGFSDSLIQLDLNHNKINGSLPNTLINIQMLQAFNVSYNRLCGQIPQGGSIQPTRFDESSYLHNKCLCGSPLPPC